MMDILFQGMFLNHRNDKCLCKDYKMFIYNITIRIQLIPVSYLSVSLPYVCVVKIVLSEFGTCVCLACDPFISPVKKTSYIPAVNGNPM